MSVFRTRLDCFGQVTLSAFSVVEAFDVVEHIRSRLVSGAVVTSFDALSFERSKSLVQHKFQMGSSFAPA